MKRLLAPLLIWLALLTPAMAAAPTYNSHLVNNVEFAGASSVTVSMTPVSATDRAVVCAISSASLNNSRVTSVVFNSSETFTLLTDNVQTPNANQQMIVAGLLSPTVTTANLVVTWDSVLSFGASTIECHQYDGVKAFGDATGSNGTGLVYALGLLTTNDDSMLVGAAHVIEGSTNLTNISPGSGITERSDVSAGTTDLFIRQWMGDVTVAADHSWRSVDASSSWSDNYTVLAVELRSAVVPTCTPSAGGGSGDLLLTLLGVGDGNPSGAAVSCYWQLEASTDRWELEAVTDDWILE